MTTARHEAITPRVQLDRDGKPFLAPDRIDLLRAIVALGSITQAARRVGLSYKGAWDAVAALNQQSEQPLVVRVSGGTRGGGTQLTAYGVSLLAMVEKLEAANAAALGSVDKSSAAEGATKSPTMRTSARNQWLATIRSLNVGMVTTDVRLALDTGVACVAQVTTHSANALGLRPGLKVCALVKATAVKVGPVSRSRTNSEPNCLRGVVRSFEAAEGFAEISVRVSKKCVVSAIAHQRSVRSATPVGSDVDVAFSPQSVLLVMPA